MTQKNISESDFANALTLEFESEANAEIASAQRAYMKNPFEFYSVKAPVRQQIQKKFCRPKAP